VIGLAGGAGVGAAIPSHPTIYSSRASEIEFTPLTQCPLARIVSKLEEAGSWARLPAK